MLNQRVQQIFQNARYSLNKPSLDGASLSYEIKDYILQDYKNQDRQTDNCYNWRSGIFLFNIYDDEYTVYYNLCTFEKTKYNKYRTYCSPDIFNKTIDIHVKLNNGQADNEYFLDVIKSGIENICKFYNTRNNEMTTDYYNGIYQKAVANLENDNWKVKIFARALYSSFDFIQDAFICNITGKLSPLDDFAWHGGIIHRVYSFPECMYYQDMVYALNLLDDYNTDIFGLTKNDFADRIMKQSIKYANKIATLCNKSDKERDVYSKYHFYPPFLHSYENRYITEIKKTIMNVLLYFGNKSDNKIIDKEKACFLIWLSDRLMTRRYGKRLAESLYTIDENKYMPVLLYVYNMIFNDQPVLIDCYRKEKEYISDTDEPFDNSVKFLMVNHGDSLEVIADYDNTVITDDIKDMLDKVYDYFVDIPNDELESYIQAMPEWNDGRHLNVNSFFLGKDEFFNEDEQTLMDSYEKYINEIESFEYQRKYRRFYY